MIDKIHKLIFNNLIFIGVIVIGSIIIVVKEGSSYFFNYASLLICLFLPIFLFIDIYKISRQSIRKEVIRKQDIYFILLYTIVTLSAFFFGLERSQAKLLLIIDSILCFGILLVMLYLTYKSNKTEL